MEEVVVDLVVVVLLDSRGVDVDEVDVEELLLPPPIKTVHVLPRLAMLLNASAILPVEFDRSLVTSNLAFATWPEAKA